jgi:hypothetical protein
LAKPIQALPRQNPKKDDAGNKCEHDPGEAALPEHIVHGDTKNRRDSNYEYAVLDQAQERNRYDKNSFGKCKWAFFHKKMEDQGEKWPRAQAHIHA